MSDTERRDEETEVEGHRRRFAGNEEEPGDEGEDNEVEAHKRHMNARMDSLKKD